MAKQMVRVWEPEDADDFRIPLPDLISKLASIQIENTGRELTFRTEKDYGYYDSPDTFDCWIERPETDEEEAERVRKEEASTARYEALKRKFEDQ